MKHFMHQALNSALQSKYCLGENLPQSQYVTHGHFIVGSHVQIKTHMWLFKKKMLVPENIPHTGASQPLSY